MHVRKVSYKTDQGHYMETRVINYNKNQLLRKTESSGLWQR